jgi:antitoxin VapB
MTKSSIAKLFQNGRSQAVRLPREFRFQGDAVRVRRVGNGVLLEPISSDVNAWFERLDQFKSQRFMERGRRQPPAPKREPFE